MLCASPLKYLSALVSSWLSESVNIIYEDTYLFNKVF